MSFGLPASTEVSRQLPKKAIIEKFGLTGKERTRFDSTIHRIIITNEETGEELCAYNLKERFSTETAVVAGALVLNRDGEWEFEAVGKGYDGGLQTLVDMYA